MQRIGQVFTIAGSGFSIDPSAEALAEAEASGDAAVEAPRRAVCCDGSRQTNHAAAAVARRTLLAAEEIKSFLLDI